VTLTAPLQRVYLDQRDWVRLARQHYGRLEDEGVAGVLAFVLEASSTGCVSFPLSAVHYEETYRRGDPASRQRLGSFMAEVSRFHAIASPADLLAAEVRAAVRAYAGLGLESAPGAFGRGVAHAFGQPAQPYLRDPEARRRAVAQFGEDGLFDLFERALLAGPNERMPTAGIALPTREFAQRQLDFEKDTARRLRDWGHTSDRAHRVVLAQEAQDNLTAFTLSLPAKGAICRMRMTAHEDQAFRWHIGDLNDMTALGTAAGYCDVLVAENQWGSILGRHRDHLRARVTSNLLDLPTLLDERPEHSSSPPGDRSPGPRGLMVGVGGGGGEPAAAVRRVGRCRRRWWRGRRRPGG